ncbi:MAG: TetR/AcrR family transcriptional regulator [Actinobacteria bacterium]|nr:TetR/AcrR family transcriptional regulator [Actinomycetota bacterium]
MSADETREHLLHVAADVFGRLGYERATISQITSAAGLSSGAIYAHYPSKAELFVATLRAHADIEFHRLLGGHEVNDFASFLEARGRSLDRRTGSERTLLIEAVVAAKRHPEVAEVLARGMLEREDQLTVLLRAAQSIGEVDRELPAEAVVRFALMVAMGSMAVAALDLPPVDHEDWAALVGRLVDIIRVPATETDPK